ncbi:hypothetical protein [Frondihabitans australicus]|uniref:O-antigen ligase-like membrane protein n=1 Tax=Frondihabitans australicus TaxID=386892 RepID=A0A495IDZ0_9MICO|nr:hypothetical protein [Frondihabitans australicus]RKR73551.1 hypothetical protein C8E83_0644 [Frondihabitans australicus]
MTAMSAIDRPRRLRRQHEGPYLAAMMLCTIVLQRFALSFGGNSIPLILPVILVFIAVGYATRVLEFDRFRGILVAILCLTGLACSLAQIAVGAVPSIFSLGLLAVLYVPAAFRSSQGPAAVALVATVFTRLMVGAAIVALLQFGLQYVGLPNVDWIGTLLPTEFTVQGFSPNAFIVYGSELRRSNGVIFLEPSFLSMYLGLAILIGIRRRTHWAVLLILLAGMVPTLAGNGLVILIPGAILTFFSPIRRNLLALLPGLVAAVAAAAVTPLGRLYVGRSGEASNSTSSSSFRFVQPYTRFLPASFDSPFHTLFGHGSGTADDYLNGLGLSDITRATIPKILFEYGMAGAVGILGVICVLFALGLAGRPWLLGLAFAFLFLNASLLQAELVFCTVFWLNILPPPERASRYSAAHQPILQTRVVEPA